jgi:hypothetical protein
MNAKHIVERCDYDHDILKLKESTVEKIKECGGLRFFSFADYYDWMDPYIDQAIEDARKRGIPIKAITKSKEFVLKYAHKFDIINVSVDMLGEGMDHSMAKVFKALLPNVKIRIVVTDIAQTEDLDWVDVITLNHGRNGYHSFTKKEMAAIADRYPDKVCCQTGRCNTCKVKCGGRT